MPPTSRPGRNPDKETDEDRFYNGVTFGSDAYVPWVFGKLRLGKCDTSRLGESGCPVLRSHQPDNLVGAVLTVEKKAGLWHSDWRLPKISSNRRTFDEMDAGILRGVSVGGRLYLDTLVVDNEDEAKTLDDMRFTCDWCLVEESLTGIPADTSATVDRIFTDVLRRDAPAVFDTLISPQGIFTAETPDLQRKVEALRQSHNESIALRRQEANMTTVPLDLLERTINDYLNRSDALKSLGEVPAQLAALSETTERLEREQMTLGHKLNTIQFQPGGAVLQMGNWNPLDEPLNIGRILRLTADSELGFPQLDRSTTTLEESFLEQQQLVTPDRSTAARVPFAAIEERSRQRMLQRASMSDAAGARPTQVNVVGTAGLLMNDYAPILAMMTMRDGLRGTQEVPYWTAQGSAAGGAEGSDIPIETWTLSQSARTPISIGSAFDLSSSLQATDPGTFESLIDFAIRVVCNDELCDQVLDGGGSSANEIAGLWGQVASAHNVDYGAAQSDFGRADVLTLKNHVDLSKAPGGPGSFILGTSLHTLAEGVLRGGTASDRYLLEDEMMEGRMVHHFADFAPTGITDPGLYVKLDQCVLLLWGDSFQLQEVPVRARKSEWKMVVEANMGVLQPNEVLARIKQT